MKRPPAERLVALRRAVLRYYRRERRDLPWRRSRDPYHILVSEVMLQQTQVPRVVPKYRDFLRRFPTVRRLARARLADVLRAWAGLGYNNRALRLWRCAQIIVARHAGRFPNSAAALRALPGVGQYTAAALASFAFGEQTAAIDVNVGRVLARTLAGADILTRRQLAHLAVAALPRNSAADWTQALMDIGARFCRPAPQCAACPARRTCRYARAPKSAAVAESRATRRKGQPPFAGSTRFYRGRVIRILTNVPSLSLAQLGVQVKPGFNLSDRPWLHAILRALQRDGLVRISRGARISLA